MCPICFGFARLGIQAGSIAASCTSAGMTGLGYCCCASPIITCILVVLGVLIAIGMIFYFTGAAVSAYCWIHYAFKVSFACFFTKAIPCFLQLTFTPSSASAMCNSTEPCINGTCVDWYWQYEDTSTIMHDHRINL